MSDQQVLWRPTPDFIEKSNLKQYERWLSAEKGLNFTDYAELWQWSVDNIAEFWESIWQFFEITAHQPYERVITGQSMPGISWFEHATVNYAEHLFRHRNDDLPAIIFQSEQQAAKEISWHELESKAAALKFYLERQGIGKGDCVAAYIPNIPEAIIAFLAVNALGAVWSCCSPDFGVRSVIDRFQNIEPKIFIASNGYYYNGKAYSRIPEITRIQEGIPSIEGAILLDYVPIQTPDELPHSVKWETIMTEGAGSSKLSFTPVPFNHPIWVLYSSGTTGRPKAITHSHGGVLLEHLKYLAFHNDVRPGEKFFWFTTTGWMMWNFLQASMLAGGIPVLYDGSPGYPDMNILWEMAEKLEIQHFGVGAPFLTACMKADMQPGNKYQLTQLRSIGSTGSPLPAEAFQWVYDSVSSSVWLCSISGGTDICTAFVGGNPYLPVHKGAIQSRALGCALQAYNSQGKPVEQELGEMVVEQPMPSMPVFFWNDPEDRRYRASYFEQYPGKWRHGDWIQIHDNGSLVIYGRSDATLNRKGVRIGTAEIYAVLNDIPEIQDCLVLNLEGQNGDDIMPLFILLAEGATITEDLKQLIAQTLRTKCSPRHVPDLIEAVPHIPYTLSGKKMEVPVKRILLGMELAQSLNKDVVRNPEAIDFFLSYATTFRANYL